VQENCIDLVGRIADRGASYVPAREWMRICFELLDMLKAHKKAIRRATVNTFGYIAKAIGPQVRLLQAEAGVPRGACVHECLCVLESSGWYPVLRTSWAGPTPLPPHAAQMSAT